MTIQVIITPGGTNYFYELFMIAPNIDDIAYNETLSTDGDWTDPGIEFEAMDYPNELDKAFEITNPYKDLEPCKPMALDDRYTGKCKKLRREARGW